MSEKLPKDLAKNKKIWKTFLVLSTASYIELVYVNYFHLRILRYLGKVYSVDLLRRSFT